MLSREEYLCLSLETNLFFQRIMKEHLLFIESSLQPVETARKAEANRLKRAFEELLAESVEYAQRIKLSEEALQAKDIVTPYTLGAEEITSRLTGLSINTDITRRELALLKKQDYYVESIDYGIRNLNARSLNLLEEVINYQRNILALALRCEIYTTLYPELLLHVTQEAVYYREMLTALQSRRLPRRTLCGELNFWNHVMGDHAQFIACMLDPREVRLKETADNFAERFAILVERCLRTPEREIIQRSRDAAERVRNFKRAATEGILACEIKSIIPPLLADHVLREANHYLKILRNY